MTSSREGLTIGRVVNVYEPPFESVESGGVVVAAGAAVVVEDGAALLDELVVEDGAVAAGATERSVLVFTSERPSGGGLTAR